MAKLLGLGKLIGSLLLAATTFAVLYFSFMRQEISSSRPFVVGVNPFMPYVFIEESGAFNGFDIELAREIAERLGKKLEIKNMSFDALTIELVQGKVDCIIGGLSITADRQKKMDIIHYTGAGKTSIPLVFWRNFPEGVKGVEDLKLLDGSIVCVQPGSLQEDLFSRLSFIKLRFIDSITDMIMEIRYGKALACALEHEVARSMSKKYPELKLMTVPLPKDLQDHGIGIGLSKKKRELADKVRSIIKDLKGDGTIKRLERRWFEGGDLL